MTRYTVDNFPRDLKGAGWFEIAPKRIPCSPLREAIVADFVVIGSGPTGIACAHRLAELNPKSKIVLIEALAVAEGAGGRNSGFMIDMPHDLTTDNYSSGYERNLKEIAFNRYGIAFAIKKAKQFKMDKVCFSIDGKYHGSASPVGEKALATYMQGLDAIGEEYTALDAKDMKRITGIAYYTMGLHTKKTPIIQPALYHMTMADNLPKNVALYENTPVTAIDDGDAPVVYTANGKVSCGKIVLATNAHLESFGFKKNCLMNIMLTGSMTRKLTGKELKILGGIDAWALTPSDPLGSTVRKTRDGRILMRNQALYNPKLHIEKHKIDGHLKRHKQAFDLRFPMLKNMEMQYTWGGNLCLSRNNVSVFEEVADNVYTASVNNGLGLAKGTTQGVLMAEYLSGLSSPFIDDLLAQAQPKRLFPEPFMSIGVNSVLKYKIWRAGKDL